MKLLSKFVFIAMITLAITSCKKEDANLPFNQLDEETNKQLVEDSAIDAAKAVDELKDHMAVDASVSMAMHMSTSNPIDAQSAKKSKVTRTIEALAALDSDKGDMHEIFAAMNSPQELADDPETIQEAWDMLIGTYTWNPGADDWDYAANSNNIIFIFPSTENGTSNNATLTISNYTGVMVSNPLEDEYNGDLPTSLNMEFEVDGATVLTYTFAAAYDADGIPTSVASNLKMDPFEFATDLTNNDTEASASYKFTKGGDNVIAISAGIEGDFTQENIDNNTVTHFGTDWVYNPSTQMYEEVIDTENTWDEVAFEEVIQTGHFKFQLYNISVGGTGDIKGAVDEIKLLYPENYNEDPNYNEQAAATQGAAIFNQYIDLYAIDEDSRKKIADVEAYVVEDNYDGYTNYRVDFRLVFGDGSLVDLETYFTQGFEDFVAELNSMIDDINTEYELDFDHIDY